MTRTEAIKKLKRMLGPTCYWRIGEHQTSPEKRRAAMLEFLDIQFCRAMIERDRTERRRVLLLDPEYQALTREVVQAQKTLDSKRGHPTFRFEVGTSADIAGFNALSPKAYGDTWEEIFEKLKSAAIALILFLLLASPLSAADFTWAPYAVLMAGQYTDAVTTLHTVPGRSCRETNPQFGPQPSIARLMLPKLALVASIGVLMHFAEHRESKTARWMTKGLAYTGGAVGFKDARSNVLKCGW